MLKLSIICHSLSSCEPRASCLVPRAHPAPYYRFFIVPLLLSGDVPDWWLIGQILGQLHGGAESEPGVVASAPFHRPLTRAESWVASRQLINWFSLQSPGRAAAPTYSATTATSRSWPRPVRLFGCSLACVFNTFINYILGPGNRTVSAGKNTKKGVQKNPLQEVQQCVSNRWSATEMGKLTSGTIPRSPCLCRSLECTEGNLLNK